MFRYVRYLLACFPAFGAPWAFAVNDDFADALTASTWSLVQDAPGQLDLAEQNGRLETLANNPVNNAIDALYLSDGASGFRLSTSADFEITLDYALTDFDSSASVIGDALGLAFGVGRDLDGTDSAAIGYGVSKQSFLGNPLVGTALAAAYRTGDLQTEIPLQLFGPSAATFRIAYDAAGDDLTLGITDPAVSAFVLEDTVRGVWNADALYVSFGARGGGFSLDSGDAWLDNVSVVTGDVLLLPAPLPGDYDRSGLVEQGDLNLVLNGWGQARVGWSNAEGFTTAAVDQEELNRVLNNWGSSQTPDMQGGFVPEPTAAGLAALAFGLCGLRRRGRRAG
ncbi:MAG: hypothetical protein AAGF84_12255 [Planctomycetota bacterium]